MGLSYHELIAIHGDADITRAASRFMQRSTPKPGTPDRDIHAVLTSLGAVGNGPIPVGYVAIIPIVKPCRLIEWTVDAVASGDLTMTVDYADWAIPRAWASITSNPSTLPMLTAQPNNGGYDMDTWRVYLNRKGAIRVTITGATVEQALIVFYVVNTPRGVPIP